VAATGTTLVVGSPRTKIGDLHLGSAHVYAAVPQPSSYCTAKLSSNGCLPSISGHGTPSMSSPGDFSVVTTGIETAVSAIDFYGTTGQASTPFQGGVMCVASPVYRTGGKFSGGSGTCAGSLSFTLSELLATPNGQQITAGGTVYVETWSRDLGDAFGSSLSDALQFTVCP
jgi:hypothetical protein